MLQAAIVWSLLGICGAQVVGSQIVEATIPNVHSTSERLRVHDDHGHDHSGHEHGFPGGHGRSLMCNCSFPASLHCSFDGLCDAAHVALHLRNEIRTIRRTVAALARDPDDAKSDSWRRRQCQKMATGGEIHDLLLLDYESWEPACLRLSASQTACGMGPASTSRAARVASDGYAAFPPEVVNAKLATLFQTLGCNGTLDEVTEPVYICQGGDHCNSIEPLPREGLALSDAPLPTWFWIVVPLVTVLFLLSLLLIAYCAWRGHLWKAVLKVQDREHNQKYYDDVDITDVMPSELPAKDVRPEPV